MNLRRFLILLTLPAALAACGADETRAADRGALTKAESLGGSCVDACGEQSAGGCWCDDSCEVWGDCCDDKAAVCDAPPACEPEPCPLRCAVGLKTDEHGCQICECELACGGFTGESCPDGLACVDFAADQCDPAVEGADCIGICVPPSGSTCNTDAYCDAVCAGEEPPAIPPGCPMPLCACPAPPPTWCGGFADLPCPPDQRCVDYPDDTCAPWSGGADCIGVCEPVPPDTCAGHCGDESADGSCWCDEYCTHYGDCCTDVDAYCADRAIATGTCVRNGWEPCETDADCTTGGCGGELCYNPAYGGGITTCDCAGPGAPVDGCGCVQGVCAWYE